MLHRPISQKEQMASRLITRRTEPSAHLDPAVSVCRPLHDAKAILQELGPASHAHLEKKLGGGAIGPFGSRGWGDGLGWGHEVGHQHPHHTLHLIPHCTIDHHLIALTQGPLSTTLRFLPRLLNALLSPLQILHHLPIPLPSFLNPSSSPSSTSSSSSRRGVKISRSRRSKIDHLLALMDQAERDGCVDVYEMKGRLRMLPPKGVKQDLVEAYDSYKAGRITSLEHLLILVMLEIRRIRI